MSTGIALIPRTSIQALQASATAAIGSGDLFSLLENMAAAGRAAEGREEQFQRAMSGQFVTVTKIGDMMWEQHGISMSPQNLNISLVEMGLQTRVVPRGGSQASYFITDTARDLGAGMNIQTGQIGSVRWDEGIVMMVVDHVTKPDEEVTASE